MLGANNKIGISLMCSISSVYTVTAIATNYGHLAMYLCAALDSNCFHKLCFLFFATLLGLAGNHRDRAEEGRKMCSGHIITKCRKFLIEFVNEKMYVKPFQLRKNRHTNKSVLIVSARVYDFGKSLPLCLPHILLQVLNLAQAGHQHF